MAFSPIFAPEVTHLPEVKDLYSISDNSNSNLSDSFIPDVDAAIWLNIIKFLPPRNLFKLTSVSEKLRKLFYNVIIPYALENFDFSNLMNIDSLANNDFSNSNSLLSDATLQYQAAVFLAIGEVTAPISVVCMLIERPIMKDKYFRGMLMEILQQAVERRSVNFDLKLCECILNKVSKIESCNNTPSKGGIKRNSGDEFIFDHNNCKKVGAVAFTPGEIRRIRRILSPVVIEMMANKRNPLLQRHLAELSDHESISTPNKASDSLDKTNSNEMNIHDDEKFGAKIAELMDSIGLEAMPASPMNVFPFHDDRNFNGNDERFPAISPIPSPVGSPLENREEGIVVDGMVTPTN